jgi:hypothetical protein
MHDCVLDSIPQISTMELPKYGKVVVVCTMDLR